MISINNGNTMLVTVYVQHTFSSSMFFFDFFKFITLLKSLKGSKTLKSFFPELAMQNYQYHDLIHQLNASNVAC